MVMTNHPTAGTVKESGTAGTSQNRTTSGTTNVTSGVPGDTWVSHWNDWSVNPGSTVGPTGNANEVNVNAPGSTSHAFCLGVDAARRTLRLSFQVARVRRVPE